MPVVFNPGLTAGQEEGELADKSAGVTASEAMGQGAKLRELLSRASVSQSELGRSMGLSPTSIGRFLRQLDEGKIKEENWAMIAQALVGYGIDPEQIRPLPSTQRQRGLPTELLPNLDLFDTPELLDAVIRILRADQKARDLLLIVAEDRLTRSGK